MPPKYKFKLVSEQRNRENERVDKDGEVARLQQSCPSEVYVLKIEFS